MQSDSWVPTNFTFSAEQSIGPMHQTTRHHIPEYCNFKIHRSVYLKNLLSSGQLSELRKTSLARIICDNADSTDKAQPLVMHAVGPKNEHVSCTSIPGPDFSLWQDQRVTHTKLGQLDIGIRALSTHFQVRIISGYVLSDEESVLWNGQIPLPFPADFNLKPHWSGTLTSDSLHGTFSVQLSSQQWVNGQFFFKVSRDWIHSRPLQVSGNFMSPVYFKEVEDYSLPASFPSSVELSGNMSSTLSAHTTSEILTAPIALEGTYSVNRTVFWWSGDIVLTIFSSSQHLIDTRHNFSPEGDTENMSSEDENPGRHWSRRKKEMSKQNVTHE